MARRDKTAWIRQLQKSNVMDIQKRISEELADKIAREQKKESKFRNIASVLKTAASVIPGAGKLVSLAVDPVLRKAGMGADPSKLKAGKGQTIFGGRKAFETAESGLRQAQRDYEGQSLKDTLTMLAAAQVGGKLFSKFGGKGVETGKEIGDVVETPYSTKDMLITAAKDARPSVNIGDTANAMRVARPSYFLENPGQALGNILPYWQQKLGYKEQGGMVQNYKQGGIIQKFIDGGMVQKYENGGEVNWDDASDEEIIAALKEMDTSEAKDYVNTMESPFTKTEQGRNIYWAKKSMAITLLKSVQGTPGDISQLVEDKPEVGIADFKRNPEMMQAIRDARSGDSGAMENLVAVARSVRPELVNMDTEDLKKELGTLLTDVDPYGQGYKDVALAAGEKVKGLRGAAAKTAGMGSMMAGTGVGMGQRAARQAQGSLTSKLSDIYSARDIGFEEEVEAGFGGFESAITGIGN